MQSKKVSFTVPYMSKQSLRIFVNTSSVAVSSTKGLDFKMVKLFQRCPNDEKILLYILFKKVPEQSGNNYDTICYTYLFWKFLQTSQ